MAHTGTPYINFSLYLDVDVDRLKSMPCLTHLDLQFNPLTSVTISQLRQELPQITLLVSDTEEDMDYEAMD